MSLGSVCIFWFVFQAALACISGPTLNCPSSKTYTAYSGKKYAVIHLGKPGIKYCNSYRLRQIEGPSSGSKFYEGSHRIRYKVTDGSKKSDYCSYYITIKVIRCSSLSAPYHGSVSCDSDDIIYGTDCDFSCDTGYRLVGYRRSRCQENGQYSHSAPSCSPYPNPTVTCPNSKSVTAGYFSKSAVVTYGSIHISHYADSYKLDRIHGKPSGSTFSEGSHTIQYKGTDGYSRTGYCSFTITVKVVRCSSLSIPFHGSMRCDNSEHIYGTDCYFSCDTGYEMSGYQVSSCQKNGNYNHPDPTCNIIKCDSLPVPDHGGKECDNYLNTYGTHCSFTCDQGYELDGHNTSTCQRDKVYSHPPPECKRILCPVLILPPFGLEFSCTEDRSYGSVCGLECKSGYSEKGEIHALCQHTAEWSTTNFECTDVESPRFINCPNGTIQTTDNVVKWPAVKVNDNSGNASLKLTSGLEPGSTFSLGSHFIRYDAEDSEGNKAEPCFFTVHVQELNCSHPSEVFGNDSMVDFEDCSSNQTTFTEQTTCKVKCKTGTLIQGSKFIRCERKSKSVVEWVSGKHGHPHCPKKACPALRPPNNGAIVWDTFLSETVCMVQCELDFDIDEKVDFEFVCGRNSKRWYPSDTIPDCREICYGEEYRLPNDFYYFLDDCNNEEVKEEIKNNFIESLKISEMYSDMCKDEECKISNVRVRCGEQDYLLRRRREAKMSSERFAERHNRTSTEAHMADLNSSLSTEKSNDSLNVTKNQAVLTLHFDIVIKTNRRTIQDAEAALFSVVQNMTEQLRNLSTTPLINSKTFNVTVMCQPGYSQARNIHGKCVACGRGTFNNKSGGWCLPCPVNSYQNQEGQISCLPCPQDSVTPTIGTQNPDGCIVPCSRGTFHNVDTGLCTPCPKNTYQPERGQLSCIRCPPKTGTLRNGTITVADCIEICGAGSFRERVTNSCLPCPKMSYQHEPEKYSCIFCPRNSLTLSYGKLPGCVDYCRAGTFHNVRLRTCVPCPLNTYQPREGKPACISCPLRSITLNIGTKHYSECAARCKPGTFHDRENPHVCVPCPPDTYQDETGKTLCLSCPPGTKTHHSGTTAPEGCVDIFQYLVLDTFLPFRKETKYFRSAK